MITVLEIPFFCFVLKMSLGGRYTYIFNLQEKILSTVPIIDAIDYSCMKWENWLKGDWIKSSLRMISLDWPDASGASVPAQRTVENEQDWMDKYGYTDLGKIVNISTSNLNWTLSQTGRQWRILQCTKRLK